MFKLIYQIINSEEKINGDYEYFGEPEVYELETAEALKKAYKEVKKQLSKETKGSDDIYVVKLLENDLLSSEFIVRKGKATAVNLEESSEETEPTENLAKRELVENLMKIELPREYTLKVIDCEGNVLNAVFTSTFTDALIIKNAIMPTIQDYVKATEETVRIIIEDKSNEEIYGLTFQ